jgi:hypothetical protein
VRVALGGKLLDGSVQRVHFSSRKQTVQDCRVIGIYEGEHHHYEGEHHYDPD